MTFASRPKELTFQAKYAPKNSADKGLALFALLDKDGNIIAEGRLDIESSNTYSKKSIKLNLTRGIAKAAKIQVTFKSTNAGNTYLNKNNLTPPPSMNLSTGESVGSQLYIDDLELID